MQEVLQYDLQYYGARYSIDYSWYEPIMRISQMFTTAHHKMMQIFFTRQATDWKRKNQMAPQSIGGWWFQIFLIFIPTWGNDSI